MKNIKIRNAINKDIKDIFCGEMIKILEKTHLIKISLNLKNIQKWYLESLRDKKNYLYRFK